MISLFLFFSFLFHPFSWAQEQNQAEDIPVMVGGRVRPLSATGLALDETLPVFPDRYKPDWHPLKDLNSSPMRNISSYSDEIYFGLVQSWQNKDLPEVRRLLSQASPPSWRFEAEKFYTKTPLIPAAVILYTAALLFLLFGRKRVGLSLFFAAFGLHTLILALRSYILERPPVSSMDETLLYVPWIGALLSFAWTFYTKETLPAVVGAFMAAVLLLTPINNGLENVQPVLNSPFWLTTHVLMIVASYGVLIFAGLLGHIYLFTKNKKAERLLLPTLYMGVALLIPGTILGGIWAAESWGRFWDWDPKESWAFISASIYLVFIHARRFGKIETFGLAIGSVIGLMAISFTWYGVNYILGVGLHSYGFGNGGELYYTLFIAAEALIICSALIINRLKNNAQYDKN